MHPLTQKNKDLAFLNALLEFCDLTEALESDPVKYLDFYEFSQQADNLVKIKRKFPSLRLPAPREFLRRLINLNKAGRTGSVKVSVLLRFERHLDAENKRELFDLCFSVAESIDDYDGVLERFKGSLTGAQKHQLREKFEGFQMSEGLRKAIMTDLELAEVR